MPNVEFLSKVPIFVNIQPQQLAPLADRLRRRQYQRGEVIFHQDDPGDRMHIIVEGAVKISLNSDDGREKDIALFHAGDCFGEMSLLDGEPRSATATSIQPTVTMALHREDFSSFFRQNPEVAEHITTMLAQRLRNVNQMLGDMVFLDVPTRVAKQLLELCSTYTTTTNESVKDSQIVVPLGQDELARLVGASRETVSRALNSYRRQGILDTYHRRIIIKDRQALERALS